MPINEIWKPIKGYEGLYEVSNLGRVKSLPRHTTRGRYIKPHISSHNGYVYICLCKNNHVSNARLHRLVLEAFTDYVSTNGEIVIDHIDGNKTNNVLTNLEAVTRSINQLRAYELGLNGKCGTKVIDLDTKEVFESYTDASKSIGGYSGEMVARVCRGVRSHYRGHHFANYEDYINDTIPKFNGKFKRGTSKSLWR